jgi:hypothetical protein
MRVCKFINDIYEKSDTNILWNTFKNDIINSIESNIPHKLFTYKQRLLIVYVDLFHYRMRTRSFVRYETPINISTRIINQKSFLATSKALERTTRA